MFRNLRNYVKEDKYKINIMNDYVDVLNYQKILVFDDNNIVVELDKKTLTIKGTSLIINKLMNNELLIKGNICLVEIR